MNDFGEIRRFDQKNDGPDSLMFSGLCFMCLALLAFLALEKGGQM
jgi:hypothetical protein